MSIFIHANTPLIWMGSQTPYYYDLLSSSFQISLKELQVFFFAVIPSILSKYVLTFETWSCMHLAGNTACSPSVLGLRHISCHRCGRSWRSRSWWHRCPDSAARWGSFHTTAPSSPPPWGLVLYWRLHRWRKQEQHRCRYELLFLLSFKLYRISALKC